MPPSGGSDGGSQINPLSIAQAGMAKQIFGEISPLRLSLINSMMSTFGMPLLTTADLPKKYSIKHPEGIPGPIQGLFDATPTERGQIESQYGTAKENLRNTIAGRGSSLDRGLADIETGRAFNMADLIGGAKRRALGLGESMTSGGTSTAMSGMSSAAGSFFGPQRQQSSGKGDLAGALGGAAGGFAGHSLSPLWTSGLPFAGFCWIAASLYGDESEKFYLARFAIFEMWKGRLARIVQRFYLRYGERIANWLGCHSAFKVLFRPVFDFAVSRAREKIYG